MGVSFEYLYSKAMLKLHGRAIKDCSLDKNTHVAAQSHLVNVVMGRYSDIGYNCQIVDADIGSFCSLGANIRIGGSSHPMGWVSTSQVFISKKNTLKTKFSFHEYHSTKRTKLEHDIWIGDNALVKGGVTIGTGAVIGMGSVVTKDVPPYAVVAGNPAKIIKYRFDESTRIALLESAWWNYSEEKLREAAQYFPEPEKFLEYTGEKA